MPKATILVVEDERIVARDIQKTLKRADYAVPYVSASGEEAVARAEESNPDLILMDIVLQGNMDGIEAAQRIRGKRRVPIVYLTAYGDEAIVERAKATEPIAYVLKPYEERELLRTIEIALHQYVAARDRSEAELRRSEEHYRTLVENALVGVYETSMDGTILFANQELARMFHFDSPGDLLGAKTVELYKNPQDRARLLETLEREKHARNFETEWVTRAGRTRTVLLSAALEDETIVGMVQDITERRQAEKALRESETRFRSLVENASDEISIITPDGVLLYESPSANPMLGYRVGEYLGLNLFQMIHPDDVERVRGQFERLIRDPSLHPREHFRVRRRDGTWRWIEAVGTNLLAEPAVQGIVVNYHDVTERKYAEEDLRQSEERFAAAFKNNPAWLTLTHLESGKVLEVNDEWEQLIGYTREEAVGRTVTELGIYDEETWQRIVEEIRAKGSVRNAEAIARTRGGGNRTLLVSREIVHIQGDAYMLSMGLDITERKLAEEKIKTQLERLASLRSIDAAIASSTDLNMTFYVLLNQAVARLKVDAAAILLFDPFANTFEYAASQGFRTSDHRKARVRMGDGIAGRCGFERVRLEGHLLSREDFTTLAPLLAGEGFSCYTAAPLISKGRIRGVLEVFEQEHRPHDREWLDFLDTLAGQSTIAIDNFQLFDSLRRSNTELIMAYDATIEGWSSAMDLRDKETEGHTRRVTSMTVELARAMGMSEAEIIHVRRGSLLHDMGKLGIPDRILLKADKLTDEEWEIMRRHPTFAFEMLSRVAYLRPSLEIPYSHHEKWDGTGYPQGLRGEQIPLAARIFAVVDVWDALTSDRPYRPAWTREEALEYIREGSGTHFDPQVVEAFLRMIEGQS